MSYNKYDTTIRMLAISAAALLLVPLTTQFPVQIVTAASNENANNTPFFIPEHLDLEEMAKFTSTDKARATQIFLANSEVQRMINGKPYEIAAIGVGTDDLSAKPPKFYITINIVLDDKTIGGAVDIQTGTVVNLREDPITILNHSRAFATAYNTASPTTWDGIRGKLTAPTFTASGLSRDDATAFLVNGMKTGSSETSLCGDANMPNNYWLQGGMVFNSIGSGARIAWADTASGTGSAGCVAITATMVPYANTCPYRVDVFTAQAENAWKVTIVKLSPCTLASQTVTTTGMNAFTINANSIPRTSVWFEDITHSLNEPSSTWDSQFSGSPTAQSWYNPTTSSTWTAFTSENQQVHQCATPQVTTDTGPNEVITGSLANAGTATWNLQRLADNYTSNC